MPEVVDDFISEEPPPPEPEPTHESERIIPSPPPEDPPAQRFDDLPVEENTEATTQVVQENGENRNDKSEITVDKCYLWCFRCSLRWATHEIVFGEGKLPDWLELGDTDRPPFIPVCCDQCNRELRDECDSREDEEKKVRLDFLFMKPNWHTFGKESREMAGIRAGEGVTLFKRGGRIAHLDIDLFRSRLGRSDRVETLDLDQFCKDSTANFGIGKLVGGLF